MKANDWFFIIVLPLLVAALILGIALITDPASSDDPDVIFIPCGKSLCPMMVST